MHAGWLIPIGLIAVMMLGVYMACDEIFKK